MTIRITLKTDNAAFADGNLSAEAERIIATWIAGGLREVPLRDVNGNTVGKVTITGTGRRKG